MVQDQAADTQAVRNLFQSLKKISPHPSYAIGEMLRALRQIESKNLAFGKSRLKFRAKASIASADFDEWAFDVR